MALEDQVQENNQIEPEEPQAERQLAGKRFLIILLLGILIIAGLVAAYLVFNEENKQVTEEDLGSLQEAFAVPELFPEFSWQEVEGDVPNQALLAIMPANDTPKYRPLAGGRLWRAEFCGEEIAGPNDYYGEFLNTYSDFANYYSEQLTSRGWGREVTVGSVALRPVEADSPDGSTWGYIKEGDGKLRVVVLSMMSAPPPADCPAEGFSFHHFDVFVSDIMSLPPLPSPPIVAPFDVPSDWQTYRNEEYALEVEYPRGMVVNFDSFSPEEFTFGIYNQEYEGRVEGEIPQLVVTNRPYGNLGRESRLFTSDDLYSDEQQRLYDWIAEIHFNESDQTISAKCILPDAFKTSTLEGIELCNAILSTFQFTE